MDRHGARKCGCLYDEKAPHYHEGDNAIVPERLAPARSHPMWKRNKYANKKVYNDVHLKLHDVN
jgi:hypothetical protein